MIIKLMQKIRVAAVDASACRKMDNEEKDMIDWAITHEEDFRKEHLFYQKYKIILYGWPMERGSFEGISHTLYILYYIAYILVEMSLTNRTNRVHFLNLTNIGSNTKYNFF